MTKLLEQAEAGDLRSQTALALSYEVGIVTKIDLEKAIYWWNIAASNGDPQANEKIKELESKITISSSVIKRKALIVGSEAHEIETYRKTLTRLSFNALSCRSSEEALKIIFQNPDIILLLIDINLPGKNGVKLTKEIKKAQMLDRAKIILMSSSASEETIKAGRKLNLEKLLIKPFPPETLVEAVEKLYESKKNAA